MTAGHVLYLRIDGNSSRFSISGCATHVGDRADSFACAVQPHRGTIIRACDSDHVAIRGSTPDRIEALDMARRSLHAKARTSPWSGSSARSSSIRHGATRVLRRSRYCTGRGQGPQRRRPRRSPRRCCLPGLDSVRSPIAAGLSARCSAARSTSVCRRRAQRRARSICRRRHGRNRGPYLARTSRSPWSLTSARFSISTSSSRSRRKPITERFSSPAPARSISNIGRRWIQPTFKAAASSGSMPIEGCAISF